MSQRFIKFIPGEASEWLLKNYPNAFLLLCLIAQRARRYNGHIDGLEIGMAELGDYRMAGIESEKKYRNAKEVLVRLGIIEIVETRRSPKGRPKIEENQKKGKKRATKRATKTNTNGTVVKLLKSDIWDINSEISLDQNGDQKGDQRATRGRPEGDKQEEEEREECKEDHHPLTPSSESLDEVFDDSVFKSKEEKKIHVCRNVHLSESELAICIKERGSLESVKAVIEAICDSPNRKFEIKDWPATIKKWVMKSHLIDRKMENEKISKCLVDNLKDVSLGWTAREYWDSVKDQKGVLFECLGGASYKPLFVSYVEHDFKNRILEILREKKIKSKNCTNGNDVLV